MTRDLSPAVDASRSFRSFSLRCIFALTWMGGRILSSLGDLGNFRSVDTLCNTFLKKIITQQINFMYCQVNV